MFHVAVQFTHKYMEKNIDAGPQSPNIPNPYSERLLIHLQLWAYGDAPVVILHNVKWFKQSCSRIHHDTFISTKAQDFPLLFTWEA